MRRRAFRSRRHDRNGRPSGVCSTSRPTSAVSGRSDSANGQRGARSAGRAAGSVRCAIGRRPHDRLASSRCRRSEALAGDDAGLRPGLRSLRGQRSVAQPGTVRRLENYPGRGLTWRCSCQSSPAPSSASWMRCHAAPSDSSSRMRTCPRSSGICVPRPRCLATAASSSSARLPGRITWTTIAVSGTRADRSRGPPTDPARPSRFRRHRPGTSPRGRAGSRRAGSGRAHSAAARCCRGPRRRAGRGLLMLGRALAPSGVLQEAGPRRALASAVGGGQRAARGQRETPRNFE